MLISAVSAQSGPCYSRLAGKRPAEHRHADKRRDCNSTEADDTRVAERAADAEDNSQ